MRRTAEVINMDNDPFLASLPRPKLDLSVLSFAPANSGSNRNNEEDSITGMAEAAYDALDTFELPTYNYLMD
jgi:hypothetical protein